MRKDENLQYEIEREERNLTFAPKINKNSQILAENYRIRKKSRAALQQLNQQERQNWSSRSPLTERKNFENYQISRKLFRTPGKENAPHSARKSSRAAILITEYKENQNDYGGGRKKKGKEYVVFKKPKKEARRKRRKKGKKMKKVILSKKRGNEVVEFELNESEGELYNVSQEELMDWMRTEKYGLHRYD
jgi:hypothetical protein